MNRQVMDYQMAAERFIRSLPEETGNWLTDRRRDAAWRLGELGFPNRRQEAWRYSNVSGLLDRDFILAQPDEALDRKAVARLLLNDPVSGRLVFIDGKFQADLSDRDIPGVTLENLDSAMYRGDEDVLRKLGSLSGVGKHGFAALNLATMQDGAIIRVHTGVEVEHPIELLNVSTMAVDDRTLRPRHLIMLETASKASLVERYVSVTDPEAYFNNLVVEILLAEGASLHHERIQLESDKAFHLTDLHLALQADAHYQGINISMGSAWSRTNINTRFQAPGAICELDGLYFVGKDQLTDYHLDVDHAVPACHSRENFKGILLDNARGVFDGRILVQQQAQKSDAHLHNANLMLSRQAEIDTKPQLEIYADDVQCSHGTTVGQLDEQALFYLRSRGLAEKQARGLLCLGFASEIVERIQSKSLQEDISNRIRDRLYSMVE
jgi:Fe-S cluster assembly protein SufD